MSKVVGTAESRIQSFFSVLSGELSGKVCQTGEVQFARDRQVHRMRKRARINRPGLQQEAIAAFLATNDLVGNTCIDLDPQLVRDAKHFLTTVLERYNTRLDPENVQVSLDLNHLFDNWRFGPGASNGVKGTHAAQKIEQLMTCTLSCKPYVVKLRNSNAYFRLYDEANGNDGIALVYGSRLTTVPKNETTERTIAIEPLGNMALQLAAGRYLENVLRYIGLNIQTQQPKNKALAEYGSRTGGVATIDLKSASDMISRDLVRALLPPEWVRLLDDLRSPTISVPGGKQVTLNMISTMGNGFTFPLMTIIIASLLYGFRAQRGGPTLRIDWSKTALFGDDIIIPVEEYDDFIEVLADAGLIVNRDKSYSCGPFRESCGGDYWNGYDVTPFYVKSLSTDSEVYVALNQVLEWSARHNLLLANSILYLKSLLRSEKVFLVPEWLNPDQGILTASCSRRYKYLQPVLSVKALTNEHFALPLAAGGYVFGSDSDRMFFSPRPVKTRMKVRGGRLPKGFLSGADPVKRSVRVTTYIEAITSLLLRD